MSVLRRLRALPLFTTLLVAAPLADAAVVFSTQTDFPGVHPGDQLDSSSVRSVLTEIHDEANGLRALAIAVADAQRLGSRSSASLPIGLPPLTAWGSGARARARIDDLVFVNAANPADTSLIDVATNFQLDGFFALTTATGADTRAFASLSIDYGVGTGLANQVTTIGSLTRSIDRGDFVALNGGAFRDAGLGNTMSIDGVFTTPLRRVPLGVPLPLTLSLLTSANVVTRDGDSADAESNFVDTLTLARSGPVFILPPGITAHSAQAGIVDNRLQPVPLPGAVMLFAATLPALVLLHRRAGNRR